MQDRLCPLLFVARAGSLHGVVLRLRFGIVAKVELLLPPVRFLTDVSDAANSGVALDDSLLAIRLTMLELGLGLQMVPDQGLRADPKTTDAASSSRSG